ncbi:MAG: CoA-binding protein [Phycisphaerae bacterium]
MQRKTVVILGASADRSKFGNKSVRAHVAQGWEVYPVNPRGGEIEGLHVYKSICDVPRPITRVSSYLPPAVGVAVLDDVAAAQPGEFFVNPGAESDELIEKARSLGLDPILACSIVDLGVSPAAFGPDPR